jgi:hypothetical protein
MMDAAVINLDFCFTEIRFKYTDRITHEVTMKNCRNDSNCAKSAACLPRRAPRVPVARRFGYTRFGGNVIITRDL